MLNHIVNFDGELFVDCVELYNNHLSVKYKDNSTEYFQIDQDGIVDADCACNQCREEGLQQGHFLCSTSYPPVFDKLEDLDILIATFSNNRCEWIVVDA